jgi:sugar lactone lactonase YvrE
MRALLVTLAVILGVPACANGDGVLRQGVPASYPEGPLWQSKRLYFAEMGADRITMLEAGQSRTFFQRRGCGPTAIAPIGADGGFAILCHLSAEVIIVDARGQPTARFDRDADGVRLSNPNDVTSDGAGGVFFSDPGPFSADSAPQGRLVHLAPGAQPVRVGPVLWYPNGVWFDPGTRTLFASEHLARRVWRFPVMADGGLGAGSVLADLGPTLAAATGQYRETGPDGLEMAPDGTIHVAIYGAGVLMRLAPDGRILGQTPADARFVTSLAFRADGLAAVTAVRRHDAAPFEGSVRLMDLGAPPP